MLTIGEPIGTVEVKVLTSQTTHKLGIEYDTVAVCDQRGLLWTSHKNTFEKYNHYENEKKKHTYL